MPDFRRAEYGDSALPGYMVRRVLEHNSTRS